MTERRWVIEGGTLEAVYDSLEAQLRPPARFGRNLDALWDVLTTDLPGPVEIVWPGSAAARTTLGPDYDRLLAVLREAAAARGDLTLILA